MSDNSSIGLKEPDQVNWDNYNPSSGYQEPPVPLGPDGKPLVFFGAVPKNAGAPDTLDMNKQGYRNFLLDPISITDAGPSSGYTLRFTRVSTQKFEKNGKQIDASTVGNFLRSCGVQSKPQKNTEYEAAVRATAGKRCAFTLDWSAYNKDTGESIDGFLNFPLVDPTNPSLGRKSILKSGDTYTVRDKKGNITETKQVVAEVLFANAKIRFFVDPNKKR